MARRFTALPFAALLALSAAPLVAAPVQRDHLDVELVLERRAAAPGETVWAGLRLAHEPHWHTYWINPGDSGLATRLRWTLPDGVAAGDIAWPAPSRLPLGPLTNFGYEGEMLLPVPLTLAPNLAPGTVLPLTVKASWLVCKEECIPGDAELAATLEVAEVAAPPQPEVAPLFAAARAALPEPRPDWAAILVDADGTLQLTVDARGTALDPATLELFPVPTQVFGNARGAVTAEAEDRVRIASARSDVFVALPATVPLVIVQGEGSGRRAYAVDARAASPRAGAADAAAAPTAADPASGTADGAAGAVGFGLALLFAFAGGVLLNLMPCVFPVLALKALGLAEAAGNGARRRTHALAYLAGVLTAFLALAGALLALRAGGAALGWGFQLQEPWVVGALALLMVAMGLSLSGVYHIGGAWTGVGQGLAGRDGAAGAFGTGLLAVVVASPCTAPFMGPALGWAVLQPAAVALAVFAALGLGLAAPLVLVALAPALARRLPRPGAWMESFKQAMAFPLYLTAVWLLWVLGRQTGVEGMAQALLAVVGLAFALWLAGRGFSGHPLRAALAALALAGAVANLAALPAPGALRAASDASEAEPYSEARLAALRTEGRPVFVNLTAAWCITCLANERVALSSPAFREALARTGTVYLKGDWTDRDEAITRLLAQFDRNGVPLYLVYPRDGGPPRVLPQLLTPERVLAALAEAAGTADAVAPSR